MKIKFTISFILNTVAIILFTYYSLYAMEHHAQKIIIILLVILTAFSIVILFRLYFNFMNSTSKSSNLETKKIQTIKPDTNA